MKNCHFVSEQFAHSSFIHSVIHSFTQSFIHSFIGNADDLARMNSVIRAIDLLAKILAPIATGFIMWGAGHVIGAAFIAGWNLMSLFAEFAILRKVYKDNPALKIKV